MSKNKYFEPEFKDIEIDGTRYRVEKIPARTACWIVTLLMTKLLPMGMDSMLDIPNLPQNRSLMSEKDFHDLQDYCLLACKRYENAVNQEVALPVMSGMGKFAIPELEYDFTTVIGLTIHVLIYNVSSFFNGGALESLKATFKDLPLFNTKV